jgi:hypothetical protein
LLLFFLVFAGALLPGTGCSSGQGIADTAGRASIDGTAQLTISFSFQGSARVVFTDS